MLGIRGTQKALAWVNEREEDTGYGKWYITLNITPEALVVIRSNIDTGKAQTESFASPDDLRQFLVRLIQGKLWDEAKVEAMEAGENPFSEDYMSAFARNTSRVANELLEEQ